MNGLYNMIKNFFAKDIVKLRIKILILGFFLILLPLLELIDHYAETDYYLKNGSIFLLHFSFLIGLLYFVYGLYFKRIKYRLIFHICLLILYFICYFLPVFFVLDHSLVGIKNEEMDKYYKYSAYTLSNIFVAYIFFYIGKKIHNFNKK